MSSFEKSRMGRFMAGARLTLLMTALASSAASCTVGPLYSSNTGTGGALGMGVNQSVRERLASIAIDEPKQNDHFNQLVRNKLIFLLSNGAGEATSPQYHLTLNTSYNIEEAMAMDVGDNTEREGRASSGTVVAYSNYQLKDDNNKLVQTRRRSVSSTFDRPRQEYANLMAEEDAKKRAAEELAQSVYLSLAQNLATNTPPPAAATALPATPSGEAKK